MFNFRKSKVKNKLLISLKFFVEGVVLLGAIVTVITFFYQKKEWQTNWSNNEYNVLSHIDEKLSNSGDKKITEILDSHQLLLVENHGQITGHELENYLNDLSDIADVYQRGTVGLCAIDEWFSGYFALYSNNVEIRSYIKALRDKENIDYYKGLDLVSADLKERSAKCK